MATSHVELGMNAPASLAEQVEALFSFSDYGLTRDPYPLYRRMREESPVHHVGQGVVVVTPHRLVKGIFRDQETFPSWPTRQRNFDGQFDDLGPDELRMMNEMLALETAHLTNIDGEHHRRVRSAAQRAFTPKRVADLVARMEQIIDQELDAATAAVAPDEPVDLHRFAYRVPLLVIMDIMEAPHEDAELVRSWADAYGTKQVAVRLPPETVRNAYAAMMKFRRYVEGLAEQHRTSSDHSSTLVSELMDASQGDRLFDDELLALYLALLFAGHETTMKMIGNAIVGLLSHRDQWELLCGDPSLIPGAVEEMLRFESSSQFFYKRAGRDVELEGVPVREGTQILLAMGAANRDPEAFDEPDVVDIRRYPNDHVTFGQGVHYCIGNAVARHEVRLVLETLVSRYPDLELAVDPDEVPFLRESAGRGPASVPVILGRRGDA
jgi:cytochrome P450